MPIIIVLFTLLLTVNGVVGALMSFSARRATGESMDQILRSFERSSQP